MARSPRQGKGDKEEHLCLERVFLTGPCPHVRPGILTVPEVELLCAQALRCQSPRDSKESTLAFWDFWWHPVLWKGCSAGIILLSLASRLATQCVFTGHRWGLRTQASGQLIPKNAVSGMLKWSCRFPCWPPGCDVALVQGKLCWFLLSLSSEKHPGLLFSGSPLALHGIKKIFRNFSTPSHGSLPFFKVSGALRTQRNLGTSGTAFSLWES